MPNKKKIHIPFAHLLGITDNSNIIKNNNIENNAIYPENVIERYKYKAKRYKSPYINYPINYLPEKRTKLTNAGLATGAILSTNLLDSVAINAERSGLDIKTALGLATKETTLNNPTVDIKERAKISKADKDLIETFIANGNKIPKISQTRGTFNTNGSKLINYYPNDNPYLSTMQYLNPNKRNIGNQKRRVNTQEEYEKRLLESEAYDDRLAKRNEFFPKKSYLQAGFEKYKANPYSYNPGQKNYPQLVNKRAEEVWGSPEIQKWYKEYLDNRRKGIIIKKYGGQMKSKFNRPRAFWGALIGSVIGAGASLINGHKQKKAQERALYNQRSEENRQNEMQAANNMIGLLNNNAIENEYDNKLEFKYGGRKHCDFGNEINDIASPALNALTSIAINSNTNNNDTRFNIPQTFYDRNYSKMMYNRFNKAKYGCFKARH